VYGIKNTKAEDNAEPTPDSRDCNLRGTEGRIEYEMLDCVRAIQQELVRCPLPRQLWNPAEEFYRITPQ